MKNCNAKTRKFKKNEKPWIYSFYIDSFGREIKYVYDNYL